MKIAAINTPKGKVFGAVEGDSFRPFSVGGGSLRDLRHVIKLLAAGSAPDYGEPVSARARQARRAGRAAVEERHLRRQELLRPRARIRAERRRPVRRQAGRAGRSGDLHQVDVLARRSGGQDRRCLGPDRTRSTTRASSAWSSASTAKNVKREDALDYVFGYTIVNDVTARAVQQKHKQWFLGKSLDGFCPVGPYLVTRDEFGVPAEQELATYVNDERRQFAKLQRHDFRRADLHRDGHGLRAARAGRSARPPARRPASASALTRRAI